MIVNRRIVIDLLAGGRYDTAHVVQGDTYSRVVELELRQGNMAWEIPEGVSVVVEYIKADDTRGLYNTLPDGAQAWHADGNILTLMLAPQMLTANGNVVTQVRLMRESSQLSLFEFNVYVHKKISNAESEDYFNWQRTFIPNTEGAKVGQMLEITDVDDLGRVTGVKAVDLTVPDSSQKRELLLDITVVEPKDNVTYQNSKLTAEELEIITALIDPSTEFEVEVVYKAYGTPYTSCLSSRDATRTSKQVGITKLDGLMGGENTFRCSINGTPQIIVKSAYATLSAFKVYKIV